MLLQRVRSEQHCTSCREAHRTAAMHGKPIIGLCAVAWLHRLGLVSPMLTIAVAIMCQVAQALCWQNAAAAGCAVADKPARLVSTSSITSCQRSSSWRRSLPKHMQHPQSHDNKVSGPDLRNLRHLLLQQTAAGTQSIMQPTWNRLHCHSSNKCIWLRCIKVFVGQWLPCHVDVSHRGRLCMSVAVVSSCGNRSDVLCVLIHNLVSP